MKQIVLGKYVQGASHIRSNTEVQDRAKFKKLADGTVILAVADGHGSKSCPYSSKGASHAVKVFCSLMVQLHTMYEGNHEMLLAYLNREGITKIAQEIDKQWKKRILKTHKRKGRPIPESDPNDTESKLYKLKRPNSAFTDKTRQNLLEVYKQYGTTLLGMMITPSFYFAFQLGDGDIAYVDANGYQPVIKGDKILGVETHSLSKLNAWEKAISTVRRFDVAEHTPSAYMLSTDGFSNSYPDESRYQNTCVEYFEMINTHGAKAVDENLHTWLSETSEMGCGDDITLLIGYFCDE